MSGRRSLRWRLALVYGAAATTFGVMLLLLSAFLLDRTAELGTISVDPRFVIPRTDGGFITVNDYQAQLRRQANEVLISRGLTLLLVLAVVVLAATYVLAGYLLRPLRDITATARDITAARMDARIRLVGPQDELKDLADTFDDLIDRLQASIAVQNRFLRDAGHELRTPLTVIRTELDVALMHDSVPAEELRESARAALAATGQLSDKVDSLLTIARAKELQSGAGPQQADLDLSVVAHAALAASQRTASAKDITVDSRLTTARLRGDPELIQILVSSLAENAVRYSPLRGCVTIETAEQDQTVVLTLINDGPMLTAADAADLSSPFRRTGTARTGRQGGGLGLSVAFAVAEAHDARLELLPRPTGGLVVRVRFPADRCAAGGSTDGRA